MLGKVLSIGMNSSSTPFLSVGSSKNSIHLSVCISCTRNETIARERATWTQPVTGYISPGISSFNDSKINGIIDPMRLIETIFEQLQRLETPISLEIDGVFDPVEMLYGHIIGAVEDLENLHNLR